MRPVGQDKLSSLLLKPAPTACQHIGMSSKSRNILLLGSSGAAALETCRSLGEAGHRITILRLSPERTPADHSRYCAKSAHIGSLEWGVRQYVAELLPFLRHGGYDYMVPVDDLACELTYCNYEVISSMTRVVGPNPDAFAIARDRFESLGVARSVGLSQPPTVLVKRGSETPSEPLLPCLVKPVVSTAIVDDEPQRFSTREVRTADELDAKLRDDLPRVDVMLQAPIRGACVGLGFCALDGQLLGVCVTSYLHNVVSNGRCSSYRTVKEVTPRLLSIVETIARQFRWTGFMMMECQATDADLWLTDLRCRPWDSMSLDIFAGVDFPKLLIDAFEGYDRPRICLPTKAVYTRDLQMDIAWMFRQLTKGAGAKLFAGWIASLGRVLIGRERFDIERLDDPVPGIRQVDTYIRRLASKIGVHFSSAFRDATTARPEVGMLSRASTVLVVCKGNINRSIVAEQLFKAHGFTRVQSAGLLGMSGRRPSKLAEAYLRGRLGIDASKLRSQSVTRALKEMSNVDIVLCFERRHVAELAQRFPNLRGKLFLLSAVVPDKQRPLDIADPQGGSPALYLACFRRIEKLVADVAATADP